MNRYTVIFSCLLILSGITHATIYMQKDADGNVSYSDQPSKGAVEISAPTVNTTEPLSSAPSPSPVESILPEETDTEKKPYKVFYIESPQDQETIQNQPNFPVRFKLMPALAQGDKIQLVMDDQPFGKPSVDNVIDLVNVDRGTHTLYAVLVDENNTVLKRSNVITIYVHRASVNNPPAINTGANPAS